MRARRRPPTSLPPDFMRIVPQNGMDADCVVAALASVFGLTRDESLMLCAAINPDVLTKGMTDAQVDAALILARRKFRRVPPGSYDLDEDTGMLDVLLPRGQWHSVVLWAGRIIDGNAEHWRDPDDYLTHFKAKAGSLLVRLD